MNDERIKDLLSQARIVYNRHQTGILVFLEWVDSFKGRDEYDVVYKIYDFVDKKNRKPSTSIYSIDNFVEQEILEKVFSIHTFPQ